MSVDLNFSSSQSNLIRNTKNFISSVVNQAVVRPLGSPNVVGISGLIMDIIDDEEIAIDSDITDHYVEQNYAVQDHIALKPVRFTLKGYVGEQVDTIPNSLASMFSQVTALTTLGGLTPQFNVQDSQFYKGLNDAVQLGTNVLKQVKNVFQLFSQSSTTGTRQQTVYQYFYNLWKTRQLCTVETPYAIFDTMAIESFRVLQSGETNSFSEFLITFKQIQTVSSITLSDSNSLTSQNLGTTSNIPPVPGGRLEQLTASPVSLGTDNGKINNSKNVRITVENTSQNIFLQQSGVR